MHRFLLIGLALVVAGGLVVGGIAALTTTAQAGWSDPDAHVVDGLWVGAEMACPLDRRQGCSLPVDAALERVTPSSSRAPR
jgi:hypothetical protein